MKKFILIGCAATLFTIFLFGCGKETQSSTQGGGLFKYKVTITPSLDTGMGSVTFGGLFYPRLTYNTVNIQVPALMSSYGWSSQIEPKPFSVYENPNEFSVTKGQNIAVNVNIVNQKNPGCIQIRLDGYIDGKIFKTFNAQGGYQTFTYPTGVFCPNSNNGSQQFNFIIP
jgi:hypothetical protein